LKKIFCFLTVRSTSKRLKNKCLLHFGKEKVLEHVIKRCLYFKLNPIICTSNDFSDKKLIQYSHKYKIKIYRGSLNNKVLRWYSCCKQFNVKSFHTIDVDDPFFDPISVKKSMKLLKKNIDLVKPSKRSSNGGASEGYSIKSKTLKKIIDNYFLNNKNKDTEMFEKYLKMKNLKALRLVNSNYETKKTFRLTLDYIEDYNFLNKLKSQFSFRASRRLINKFLDANVGLRKMNIFRNKEWKKKQKLIINS